VWVGGGHVGEPSENQKNDRETGQQQQQQHLILSLGESHSNNKTKRNARKTIV
jgi:hypothetical protein